MNSDVPELSPRQRDVLDFIIRTLDRLGTPPTYREIGDALGIASTNGVADHIKALARKGYLTVAGHRARSLKLTPHARRTRRAEVVEVPFLREGGSWPFGMGDFEGSLKLDRTLAPKGVLFARRDLEGGTLRVAYEEPMTTDKRGEPLVVPTKEGGFIQLGPVVLVIAPR